MTEARRGFFPFITGDQVSLKQGAALALVAKSNLQITQGGGQIIGAGNSVSVSQGGSWIMGTGGNVTIDQGGSGVLAARDVRADRSFLGIVLGVNVSVEDSRVLIGSAGSAVAGFAIGLILGLLRGRAGSGD